MKVQDDSASLMLMQAVSNTLDGSYASLGDRTNT
jgi:hypothetical protein